MTTFTQQEIEFLQKHGNEVSIIWRISSGFDTLILNSKMLLKENVIFFFLVAKSGQKPFEANIIGSDTSKELISLK